MQGMIQFKFRFVVKFKCKPYSGILIQKCKETQNILNRKIKFELEFKTPHSYLKMIHFSIISSK